MGVKNYYLLQTEYANLLDRAAYDYLVKTFQTYRVASKLGIIPADLPKRHWRKNIKTMHRMAKNVSSRSAGTLLELRTHGRCLDRSYVAQKQRKK